MRVSPTTFTIIIIIQNHPRDLFLFFFLSSALRQIESIDRSTDRQPWLGNFVCCIYLRSIGREEEEKRLGSCYGPSCDRSSQQDP